MLLGLSTGCIAEGRTHKGIRFAVRLHAIELSAIREEELAPLMRDVANPDSEFDEFEYVSIHAPNRISRMTESELIALLYPAFERRWPVVLHPDVIVDWNAWRPWGDLVCIENMDKRKPLGRTADELTTIFQRLPEASFCFDIAHARQIDPTMSEARRILRQHGHRIRQIHISEVTASSRHQRIGYTSLLGFRKVLDLLPKHVPIILESPVSEDEIDDELARVRSLLEGPGAHTERHSEAVM